MPFFSLTPHVQSISKCLVLGQNDIRIRPPLTHTAMFLVPSTSFSHLNCPNTFPAFSIYSAKLLLAFILLELHPGFSQRCS